MSTVCFDIDTQYDFILPAGALYVPRAETIIPTVARLNHYAKAQGAHLISTVDAHLENDPEFAAWPPHCIAGTHGQRKPESTLVGQIVLNKRSVDCFTCAELPGLLRDLDATDCYVYGVVTEICVRHALFGLLAHGFRVAMVTDAVMSLNENAAARMLAEFTSAGGRLVTADYAASSGGIGTSLASRQSRSS